jgi:hypothetical protein
MPFMTEKGQTGQRPRPWRKWRLIAAAAILLIVGGVVLELPFLPPVQYYRFTHRSKTYYSGFAQACDVVLQTHHVTTNDVVRFGDEAIAYSVVKIAGDDRSLPRVIKQMYPSYLLVGSNDLSIIIPPVPRGGFGIMWGPSDSDSKLWILSADGEGEVTTLYQEKRF